MLTISLVTIFGVLFALLLRFRGITAGAALVSLLFGFYLAHTAVAGPINTLMAALVAAVN